MILRFLFLLLSMLSLASGYAQRRQQRCPPRPKTDCFPRLQRPLSVHIYLGGPAGEASGGIGIAVARRWDVYTGAGIPGWAYIGANYYLLASADQRYALITGPSLALCPETPWYDRSAPGVLVAAHIGAQYMACKGFSLGLDFALNNNPSWHYMSGGLKISYCFPEKS